MAVEICGICKSPTEKNKRGHGMCSKCYGRWYYQKNKAKIKQAANQWAAKNPESRRAIEKRWRESQSPQQKRAKQHRDYQVLKANPDRLARYRIRRDAYWHNWAARNIDRLRILRRRAKERYQARRAAVDHSLTEAEWQRILEDHNHRCAYCRSADRPLQKDHVIPISKGGPTVADNIVPACFPCNRTKSDQLISS